MRNYLSLSSSIRKLKSLRIVILGHTCHCVASNSFGRYLYTLTPCFHVSLSISVRILLNKCDDWWLMPLRNYSRISQNKMSKDLHKSTLHLLLVYQVSLFGSTWRKELVCSYESCWHLTEIKKVINIVMHRTFSDSWFVQKRRKTVLLPRIPNWKVSNHPHLNTLLLF